MPDRVPAPRNVRPTNPAVARSAEQAVETQIRSGLPESIQVVGMTSLGAVVIWSNEQRRLFYVDWLRQIDHAQMVLYAGIKGVDPKTDYRPLIAEQARKRVFGEEDQVGAGVHAIAGLNGVLVNLTNHPFVVCRTDDQLVIRDPDGPLVVDKLVIPVDFNHYNDASLRSSTASAINRELDKSLFDEVVDLFGSFNFILGDASQLVAFAVAAFLAGALDFRPHVWVTGPSNCGKTAALELLGRLFKHGVRLDGESTEAALRQSIGSSSIPIFMDEFESSASRRRLLKLLRNATRGGMTVKGSPSGRAIRYKLRAIALVASIDMDLRSDADRNRFAIFELIKPESHIRLPSHEDAADLGQRLMAIAIVHLPSIRQRFAELTADEQFREFGRVAEVHATGVAIQSVLRGLDYEAGASLLRSILTTHRDAMADRFDDEHEALLQDIVTSVPRLPGHDPISVGDLIRANRTSELSTLGIRIPNRKFVFIASDVVRRHLLAHTRWADANIGDILVRIEGAKRSRIRTAGNARGVMVPFEMFVHNDEIGGIVAA